MRASNTKRFLAFLLDFAIVSLIASGISLIAINILGIPSFYDDYNNALEKLQTAVNNYMSAQGEAYYSDLVDSMNSFFRFSLVNLLIDLCVKTLVVPIYFVIVPMYWKKQTIGRLALGLLVCKNNDNNEAPSFKNLLLREILGTLLMYSILGGFAIALSAIFAIICGRSLIDIMSNTKLIDKRLTDYFKENNIDPNNPFMSQNTYYNNSNNDSNYNRDDAIDADVSEPKDSNDNKDNNPKEDKDDEYTII